MVRPAATRAIPGAERSSRVRSAPRSVLRPLLALATALLAIGLLSGAALGHAQVVSLDPEDGAVLPVSPAAVTLTFNEPIGLAPGGLRVLDKAGTSMGVGDDVVDGPTITQALPALPAGWYVVTWGVVSEDGHIVRASSVFGVGDADAASRPAALTEATSPLAGPARFFGDLGLLVAAGAWAAWWLFGAHRIGVRRLAWGAAAVALAGTSAWAWLEYQDGGSAWMATSAATLTIARLVLLGVALLPWRGRVVVPAVATWLALLTLAGGGHSGGDAWSTVMLAAHVAAAAVWLGAAPAVLLALRDPGLDDAAATGVVRRFSSIAAYAVAAVTILGLALTWNLSDALAGGLTTTWVLIVGAKLVLAGAALALGAWGRRHLRGPAERSRLRRLFLVDTALLLLIAGLSAALTVNSPHVGHAGHAAHLQADAARCATTVGDNSVSLVLRPGRIGTNVAVLGGVAAGVQGVSVDFSHALTDGGAISMPAQPLPDVWQGTAVLPLPGDWSATIRVRVDTFTEQTGMCTVTVAP
ncbi:MAG: copper resistance protein CopC [Chloroflexota bacterium]